MLKVLGNFIEGSDLEAIFVAIGIYGSSTMAQIIDGKHMKRGAFWLYESFTIPILLKQKIS